MKIQHVEGIDKGKVLLYAISTCIWCKKTKRLLNDLGIAYDYIDVDLVSEQEKDEIRKEVLKWKNKASYPFACSRNVTRLSLILSAIMLASTFTLANSSPQASSIFSIFFLPFITPAKSTGIGGIMIFPPSSLFRLLMWSAY